MKERPILFSAPMIRAILAGKKSQTRRIVSPRHQWFIDLSAAEQVRNWNRRPFPHGEPGTRLWVRETWQAIDGNERARRIMTEPNPSRGWIEYAATVPDGYEPPPRWRPSIHMPRWASRIQLEITDIRVERLQDISDRDAEAEGLWNDDKTGLLWLPCADKGKAHINPIRAFRDLWESINGKESWEENPWVWVISFKRI